MLVFVPHLNCKDYRTELRKSRERRKEIKKVNPLLALLKFPCQSITRTNLCFAIQFTSKRSSLQRNNVSLFSQTETTRKKRKKGNLIIEVSKKASVCICCTRYSSSSSFGQEREVYDNDNDGEIGFQSFRYSEKGKSVCVHLFRSFSPASEILPRISEEFMGNIFVAWELHDKRI